MVNAIIQQQENGVETSIDPQADLLGPGSRLRIAREKMHLSPSDIAGRMHLTSQMVIDIENDDYQHAPQFVFVRGYLRSYAHIVGLNPDEIIDAFNSMNLDESPSDRPRWKLSMESGVSLKDSSVKWATYFIVLCLVSLVAIWWHSQKVTVSNTVILPALSDAASVSKQAELKMLNTNLIKNKKSLIKNSKSNNTQKKLSKSPKEVKRLSQLNRSR